MRWVIARVLPVPAPASTRTGPRSASATSRCSGSRAARRSGASAGTEQLPGQNGWTDCSGRRPHADHDRGRRRQSQMSQFTMYSTPWCGYCHRLRGQLDREGITYDVVDIEQQPEAAEIVESANNGNQTVPTLVYSDGTAQTNPSLAQVKEKLASRAS